VGVNLGVGFEQFCEFFEDVAWMGGWAFVYWFVLGVFEDVACVELCICVCGLILELRV